MVIVFSTVLFLSCGQTNKQTDADERFTPATLVGVSNDVKVTKYQTIRVKHTIAQKQRLQ